MVDSLSDDSASHASVFLDGYSTHASAAKPSPLPNHVRM